MYVRFSHLCKGYIGAARFWPIISYAMLGSLLLLRLELAVSIYSWFIIIRKYVGISTLKFI